MKQQQKVEPRKHQTVVLYSGTKQEENIMEVEIPWEDWERDVHIRYGSAYIHAGNDSYRGVKAFKRDENWRLNSERSNFG